MTVTETELYPIPAGVTLPPKFTGLRAHQAKAIDEIMEAFETVDVVYLDAPVGSGKSVVGEIVRQLLGVPGLYVCTDKKLQQQFLDDFPYAKVLMGRGNYPTERGGDDRDQWGRLVLSADDCTGQQGDLKDCWYCPNGRGGCPYHVAKAAAVASPLAVLNTAYLLASASGDGGAFGGKNKRGLVVVDEADVVEDSLLSFVEFEVPGWVARKLGLSMPKKAVRKPALIKWLEEASQAARDGRKAQLFPDVKERKRVNAFAGECERVAKELAKDLDVDDDEEGELISGRWLRDYDTKTLKLKPVVVGPYGGRMLWRHGEKFLLMSGTFISSDQRAADTGLDNAKDYAVVRVEMTFPVENRPIVIAPVADITRRSTPDDYLDLIYAVEQISQWHAGERVLVHTVSKHLAERLAYECELPGRVVCSYTSASGKQDALDRYMATNNGIMFAQSMDRGVDLPGDACRVVVIAKCPFPFLGDRRVKARMSLPGGRAWYTNQAVASVVQMTGRGVRSDTDHATSYILDRQFAVNLWRKSRQLLPAWWQSAVDTSQDNRWLMRAYAGRF